MSATQMMSNRRIASALRTGFDISSRTGFEQGGIISQHPHTGEVHMEFRTSGASHAVDLNNPRVPHGFAVIGNYHTHPNREAYRDNLEPSRADLSNALHRWIPSMVVTYPDADRNRLNPLAPIVAPGAGHTTQGSVFTYGPAQRPGGGAAGYPGPPFAAPPSPRTYLHNFDLTPRASTAVPRGGPFGGRGRSNSTSDVFHTPSGLSSGGSASGSAGGAATATATAAASTALAPMPRTRPRSRSMP